MNTKLEQIQQMQADDLANMLRRSAAFVETHPSIPAPTGGVDESVPNVWLRGEQELLELDRTLAQLREDPKLRIRERVVARTWEVRVLDLEGVPLYEFNFEMHSVPADRLNMQIVPAPPEQDGGRTS